MLDGACLINHSSLMAMATDIPGFVWWSYNRCVWFFPCQFNLTCYLLIKAKLSPWRSMIIFVYMIHCKYLFSHAITSSWDLSKYFSFICVTTCCHAYLFCTAVGFVLTDTKQERHKSLMTFDLCLITIMGVTHLKSVSWVHLWCIWFNYLFI